MEKILNLEKHIIEHAALGVRENTHHIFVPYTGANANVDLGSYDFATRGTGTFDAINISQSVFNAMAWDCAAVAGTASTPLITIDDDRTGVTANNYDEATLSIDSQGAFSLATTKNIYHGGEHFRLYKNMFMPSDAVFYLGGGWASFEKSRITHQTTGTTENLVFGVCTDPFDNVGGNLIISPRAAAAYTWTHAKRNDPTLFIQSGNYTNEATAQPLHLGLYHNQTDGYIFTGAGDLILQPATGRVGIGTTDPSEMLEILSDDADMDLTTISETAEQSSFHFKRARGVVGTPTQVLDKDALGSFAWYGYDGTDYLNAVKIDVRAEGDFTVASIPARIGFWTAPVDSVTKVERLTILSGGNVGIGTSTPQALLDVGGMIITNEGTENIFMGEGTRNGALGNHSIFIGHHAGYNNDILGSLEEYTESIGTRNIYIGARVGAGGTLLTGTVTGTHDSDAIVGSGTLFNSELSVGDIIRIEYGYAGTYGLDLPDYGVFEVTDIADDTHLTIDAVFPDDTGSGIPVVLESGSNKGSENIGIGHLALNMNSEGYECTAVGDNALQWNTIGRNNTAMGNDAMQGSSGVPITGSRNISIGGDTFYVINSGENNTALGYQAGFRTTTGSNNVFLGHQAGHRQTTNSSLLIVDNQDRGSIANEQIKSLIYGVFDADPVNQILTFNSKVNVGSPDGNSQIGIYHDNSNPFIKWTSGELTLTKDVDNTNTYIYVKGEGTGEGYIRLYDEDNAEYLQLGAISGWGDIKLVGTNKNGLRLNDGADSPVTFFGSAIAGETQELKIYGYKEGDAKRSLEIGVGVDANDTASFDGLSNYYFDGNIGIGTTEPSYSLDVKGLAAESAIRSDIGFDIYPVPDPTAPTGEVSAGGSVNTGKHWYAVTYITALGETHATWTAAQIETTAGNNTVTLTIPISTDPRVTGRKIYRTKAGANKGAEYLLTTIGNNTEPTHEDTVADAELTGSVRLAYYRCNTTTNNVTVDGTKYLTLDVRGTHIGTGAGSSLTSGGNNVFVGQYAGDDATAGSNNVCMGTSAGSAALAGDNNIFIGSSSGAINTSGYSNTALGYSTLRLNGSGASNTAIGMMSGYATTGSNNTFLGRYSGYANTSGGNSVHLGYFAGKYETAGSKLFIDSFDRTTEATQRTEAIIYGVMNSTAANQILSLGGGGNVGIGVTDPDTKLQVVGDSKFGDDDTNYLTISNTGVVTLAGTAKRKLTLRPEINIDEVKKNAVPDQIQRGVFFGYQMPVYAADSHEELFFTQRVPYRWDGASNIIVKAKILLGGAEDAGDKFNFQLSWEHAINGEPVPDTSNNVATETTVLAGRAEAYDAYWVTFAVDYDIDTPVNVLAGETLGVRLRRLDATDPDVTAEPIVADWIVEYEIDKLYGTW